MRGTARTRIHRYTPSERRSRHSTSYTRRMISEAVHSASAAGQSSGCTPSSHPHALWPLLPLALAGWTLAERARVRANLARGPPGHRRALSRPSARWPRPARSGPRSRAAGHAARQSQCQRRWCRVRPVRVRPAHRRRRPGRACRAWWACRTLQRWAAVPLARPSPCRASSSQAHQPGSFRSRWYPRKDDLAARPGPDSAHEPAMMPD